MSIFRKLCLCAIALTAFTFAACGDDEEENKPAKVGYESVTVGYYTNLTDDYYLFYDVNVIFTDDAGRLMNGSLTENENFSYTIPAAKLPEKIRFALQLTAKNPLPPVEEGMTYKFGNKTRMTVVGNKADGTKVDYKVSEDLYELDIDAGNVGKYVEAYPEIVVGPYEFSTEPFTK